MTYETIARLGRGGMGVVDLARGPDGSKVALKRLTLHGSANEIIRARQRLLREAEVLRRLHHPNVVRLVDVIDEGDEIVLVMPYLSGGSLAERVAQHGPAPADEVERQARRLFGALAQAHQLGIVHRDIKPANILFDERGEPCLADFGVAQTWDQTHGLTMTGMVVGTPGFMAPEQARGEQVVPASDVFSLGATLLFAATGEGPFGPGDPALLMVRAASNKVDKVPRTLPASLRRLLSDTLDTRPERRPTAAAVVGSPHGFMAGLPSVPRPQSGLSWAIVGGVVAVVLLIAAAFTFIGDESSDGGGDRPLDGASGAPTSPVGPDETEAGDILDVPGGAACEALPYQPCGEEPAPYTDGESCVDEHADHDGDPANGCEVAPDELDGTVLMLPQDEVEATMVPDDDVDGYPVAIDDAFVAACSSGIEMALDAPPGLDLLLDVTIDGMLAGSMTVPGGESASLPMTDLCLPAVDGPGQLPPDELTLNVTAVGGGGVGEPYTLRLRVPT